MSRDEQTHREGDLYILDPKAGRHQIRGSHKHHTLLVSELMADALTVKRPKKHSCGQNRFQMSGIWRKKLDFSTVLMVEDHVILYPRT